MSIRFQLFLLREIFKLASDVDVPPNGGFAWPVVGPCAPNGRQGDCGGRLQFNAWKKGGQGTPGVL